MPILVKHVNWKESIVETRYAGILLFNRPIPLVIDEISEVPISSNQNDQENEQSEDDYDEEIDAIS